MSTLSLAAGPEQPANRKMRRASEWCRNHGVSLQTFHRWRLRADGPPCHKLFGTWFVDDDEMAAWIAGRSNRPAAPVPAVPNMTPARRREIEAARDEAYRLMGRTPPIPA